MKGAIPHDKKQPVLFTKQLNCWILICLVVTDEGNDNSVVFRDDGDVVFVVE